MTQQCNRLVMLRNAYIHLCNIRPHNVYFNLSNSEFSCSAQKGKSASEQIHVYVVWLSKSYASEQHRFDLFSRARN